MLGTPVFLHKFLYGVVNKHVASLNGFDVLVALELLCDHILSVSHIGSCALFRDWIHLKLVQCWVGPRCRSKSGNGILAGDINVLGFKARRVKRCQPGVRVDDLYPLRRRDSEAVAGVQNLDVGREDERGRAEGVWQGSVQRWKGCKKRPQKGTKKKTTNPINRGICWLSAGVQRKS